MCGHIMSRRLSGSSTSWSADRRTSRSDGEGREHLWCARRPWWRLCLRYRRVAPRLWHGTRSRCGRRPAPATRPAGRCQAQLGDSQRGLSVRRGCRPRRRIAHGLHTPSTRPRRAGDRKNDRRVQQPRTSVRHVTVGTRSSFAFAAVPRLVRYLRTGRMTCQRARALTDCIRQRDAAIERGFGTCRKTPPRDCTRPS